MTTEHPAWLVDAVPGARELVVEIDKLTSDMAPLTAAVSAAIKARVGKVRSIRHGATENDVRQVPASGVTSAEFDALNAAKAEADAAQAAHGRKITAARKRLDELMRISREDRARIAAPIATAAYSEAATALAILEAALIRAQDAGHFDKEVRDADGQPSGYTKHVSFGLAPAPQGTFSESETPRRALDVLHAHLAAGAPSA